MIPDVVKEPVRDFVVRERPTLIDELAPFVAYVGEHPFEDGFQMILKFMNGRGASVAETMTTHGLQMCETRMVDDVKDTWVLEGEPIVELDPDYLCELLIEIKERPCEHL